MASAIGTASGIRQQVATGPSASAGKERGEAAGGQPPWGDNEAHARGTALCTENGAAGASIVPGMGAPLGCTSPHAAVLDSGHGWMLAEPPPHHGSASVPWGWRGGALSRAPCTRCPSAGPLSCSGMNWRLPTGCSSGMCGRSRKCRALASSLARPGLAPSQGVPPQPCHPSRLFPLRQRRQLSFGAGGKQVPEPRAMEPSGGWGGAGGSTKSAHTPHATPRLHGSTPCQHFLPSPPWEHGESPSAGDTGVPTSTSLPVPSPGDTERGRRGGRSSPAPTFLLSQSLLQSWAAASTSILSPTVRMRRRGVCAAKPCSLLGRGPATHGPRNFPFSPWGWCTLVNSLGQLLFPLPSADRNRGS